MEYTQQDPLSYYATRRRNFTLLQLRHHKPRRHIDLDLTYVYTPTTATAAVA